MNISELLDELNGRSLQIQRDGDDLLLHGDTSAVDAALLAAIGQHKKTLLGLVDKDSGWLPKALRITPAMLTLVSLSQEQIDRIVSTVPGGAANVQDIYPLAPLQEGILFHHLTAGEGDPYVLDTLVSFAQRERLDGWLAALQAVIDRHDILRTSVLWEGVQEPVQVVWRAAPLVMQEVSLDASAGDVAGQLQARFHPRHYRIDVRQAPLVHVFIARDTARDRWVMQVLFHHLAMDHTAMEIALQEIQAHLLGRQDQLPRPLPFRNFVAQARLGVSREEHEAFFKEMLGEVDEPTAPYGLVDVQQDGSQIQEAVRMVDASLSMRLRAMARAIGVSAASVHHLAWAQVLGKLVGRSDVVFGTVLFGRMQGGDGADRVLGLFINSLPVRLQVGEEGVRDGVMRTHALLVRLLRHEHAPLALAQRCSAVPAPAPLFTTLLNYRYTDPAPQEMPLWDGVEYLDGAKRTNYPLALSVDDLAEDFLLTVQARSPVDAQRVCAYMHAALEQLVTALEREPEAALSSLQVLSPAERDQLLVEWNDTKAAYPADLCIHELFEARVKVDPKAVAVSYEDSQLSYKELNEQANRLAHHLRKLGVKPDDRVALCVERSLEMMVGLLGILKAGAAYVPLDPAYPSERLAYMLEDSRPVAILTQVKLVQGLQLQDEVVPVLALDGLALPWQEESGENLPAQEIGLQPERLAYVIYTSGSTGQPKGVMVEHRGVVNLLRSMKQMVDIAKNDCVLALTTLAFDIAALELYLPLISGVRLALIDRIKSQDPLLLAQSIEAHGVTVVQATPSTWRMLLDAGWQGGQGLKVLCGGEALPTALAQRLGEQVDALWNVYGPTETTIWSTAARVERESLEGVVHASIGRPIANTRIYILDAQGQPVPMGVAGELYIGGVGVARGYLNKPELTRERFVADPFAGEPGARMYKTGDLARYMSNGTIEFLGRNDFQVKVRGHRIELGEIEARLAEHASVKQCVVVAREDIPGNPHLAAYVVLADSGDRVAVDEANEQMKFSLFYFGAETYEQDDKYRLYVEAAKFADQNDFHAIWTPERHFHEVGSLYPNPSVLSAALAMVTSRVQLRCGSVVLPLHNPIRIAEEWSVVDNLSQGRVGLSVASGWHPRDFVLAPQNYAQRKPLMFSGTQTLQSLWRGEAVSFEDGAGKPSDIRIFPKPIQPELPLWVTAAGNPETFIQAGSTGANLLTHLLGQTIEQVAANIALYRESLARHGFDPDKAKVSLMIHTFVGDDFHSTLEQARVPFLNYMRAHLGLMDSFAKSLDVPVDDFSKDDLEGMVEFAFERYSRTASLIGTPETCLPVVNKLREIGVDELACLLDWMPMQSALDGLTHLRTLNELSRTAQPNVRELRRHVKETLPDYMLPSSITFLDRLPLTPNGKLDRKALPAPQGDAYAKREYEAPVGEVEEKLAAIWARVLQVERVGRNDNFIDLGGHSLLAIGLIESMRLEGLHADVRSLFNAKTLADLAGMVSGQDRGVAIPANGITEGCKAITPAMLPLVALSQPQIDLIVAQVPGGAMNIQDIYPLAPLQEGVLFHHLAGGEGDPYQLDGQLSFATRDQCEIWLEALRAMIRRHDILRTGVLWEDLDEPVQVVLREASLLVEELSLERSAIPAIDQLRAHFDPRHRRLDVRQAPLIRIFLARDTESDRWLMHVVFHHLAMDNRGLEILQQEIQAHLRGQPLAPHMPFRSFVAQARLGVSREEHETFFREMLDGVNGPTAPYGLVNVRQDGSQIAEAARMVNSSLSRRLRRGARALGISAASVHHLAWALVLSKLSGKDDVVFGTVVFGRMQSGAGAGQMLGLFMNTLPVRIPVGRGNARQELKRTNEALTQLLRHEHASLALAQRCSQVAAPAPLFSALLNYRHSVESLTASQGWGDGVELLRVEERTNYPVNLSVDDFGEDFLLTAQVETPIDAGRICDYMHMALEQLVAALETESETALSGIHVQPATEHHQLMVAWNDTTVAYPENPCIHALFETQAKATPDAVAVLYEDSALTYAELDVRANRLAHCLRKLGVGPDDRVALCVERGVDMVVGLLGILKAGGAYVPLDPAYPSQRLAYMLADSQPAVVLTQERLRAQLPACEADVLCLDRDWPHRMAHEPASALANPVQPHNLAYVIYTSGSTGEPKGVMVTHGGVVNFLHAMQDIVQAGANDRFLALTTLSFDIAGLELYLPLMTGATLVVADRRTGQDPALLAELLQQRDVSVMQATPATWRMLLDADWQGKGSLKALCGGEAFPLQYAQRLLERVGRLWNVYGPTETTIWSLATEIDAGSVAGERGIGRPIANTRIYILDGAGRPVPPGVVGELHIGGAGVARGYLNLPDLTAERFLDNPFHEGRMYRTGDLARYLPDGNLEFLGRNDDQVKIRGFRIELGEIEARLGAFAGVREAVVLAREDNPGDQRLVAYYTLDGAQAETPLGAQQLRVHLQATLPEYMVPTAYVRLESLPLTPNGKLDRKALPAPDGQAYASRGYEPPQGETEERLAAIWAEVLKLERVGRHDNFFELGGHSLSVVTLTERMRQAGLSTDIRVLFARPTVAALVQTLDAAQAGHAVEVPRNLIAADCDAITPQMLPLASLTQAQIDAVVARVQGGVRNVQDIYPLSPLQEGVLFHHMASSEGDPYVLAGTMAMADREKLDRFLDALQLVIDRHDVLRTGVVWEGLREPVQVVLREARLVVHEVALSADDGDIQAQLSSRYDPRRYRLDVRQAPLMHAYVAWDALNGRWLLQLLYHHLAIDYMAMEIVQDEIETHLKGQAHTLPAALPYRNFVAQARMEAGTQTYEAYFREMLGDVDEPTLPYGLSDVRGDGQGIAEASQALEDELSLRLRRQARALGVSAASLFHLGWAQVLGRLSGRDDVVFGTVLFGRMHAGEGADRALGMFMNTLPVRVKLGGVDAREAVRRTHEALAGLLMHEHAPLALAQRCSGVAAPTPLFSALLNYRHGRSVDAAVDSQHGSDGITWLSDQERTNYPLDLSVDDLGQGFALTVQADARVDAARVAGYMHQAMQELSRLLDETRADLRALQGIDILPQAERDQVLRNWNDTGTEYPSDPCIHELFEEQVEADPQAVAVVYEDSALSYGELNAKANKLAHYLRKLGVGPDDRVALCVERGPEMVVGLLAILKAGGAYVPLDPSYPAERLAYMLEDSAPVVVLTQAALREGLEAEFPGLEERVPVMELDGPNRPWEREDAGNVGRQDRGVRPDRLAYVIYTSGSTGQPKGVMVEHRGVVNLLRSMKQTIEIARNDCVLALTTLAFDIAALELYLPLISGVRLALIDRVKSQDPLLLAQTIEAHGVTVVQATPSTWRMLLDAGWQGGQGLKALSGGEALPMALAQRLGEQVDALWNVYGPTETTIWSTAARVERESQEGQVHASIGRPIANTRIYILDAQGQPVPMGVAGELYIGGVGVARGYLNKPELTQERFITDPFSADAGARMYKTGDLARYMPDGNIEFLGRNDFQVKIRGHRIELGEIEARLAEHASVRQCVVVAREDVPGNQHLAAYVVLADGDAPAAAATESGQMKFSLFYFGAETSEQHDKYQLYVEAAKFADQNDFHAIWTPERHFHEVGSLYPNPSVLSAALAMVTSQVQLRCGSVVLPLHNPIRIAEEWSVVDNLSQGRVGLSVASGWHPRDFVLAPQNYTERKPLMLSGVKTLQSLWRGDAVSFEDGSGKPSDIRIFPKPIQPELPLWVTAAGNPETFVQAGSIGANLLTHLLGQTIEDVAANITLYRESLARHGFDPEKGKVSLMIHSFVGDDFDAALAQARGPFLNYMRAHLGLMDSFAKSLDIPVDDFSKDDVEGMVEFAFERYSRTASLIGTPETCLPVVNRLREIGVDEVACLLDWMPMQSALDGLPHLRTLNELSRTAQPNVRELRRHVKETLPDYMLPSSITFLDRLPLTPNGKLDRKALPAPQGDAYAKREYEAPVGEVEEKLADIWAQVLQVERVGRQDNFFDLGGHSLLAIGLIERIRHEGMELNVRALFDKPTLAELAEVTKEIEEFVL